MANTDQTRYHLSSRCVKNIPRFHLTQIISLSLAVPSPYEGRFAIVTDVGGGMRWTRMRY